MEKSGKGLDGQSENLKVEKTPIQWLKIRAILEEACEVIFSFGGLSLTALIALGILPGGALGIGICATLAFIGISRFIATNSWTFDHNYGYNRRSLFDRERVNEVLLIFKMCVTPVISLIAGAIFTALGMHGILSLSLGLSLGIPLLGSFLVGVLNLFPNFKVIKGKNCLSSDNVWGMCMGISAVIATATFLGLGFDGILALSTAVALAAPLCILGCGIGLLTLFAWGVNKYGSEKLKGWLKNVDGQVSCLGFGYFNDKPKVEEPGFDMDINENESKNLMG